MSVKEKPRYVVIYVDDQCYSFHAGSDSQAVRYVKSCEFRNNELMLRCLLFAIEGSECRLVSQRTIEGKPLILLKNEPTPASEP